MVTVWKGDFEDAGRTTRIIRSGKVEHFGGAVSCTGWWSRVQEFAKAYEKDDGKNIGEVN